VSYATAIAVAEEHDATLRATDFPGDQMVLVLLDDGSQFTWDSAFMRWWSDATDGADYLLVFTEHHGYHVYEQSEVLRYAEFVWRGDVTTAREL